MKNKHFHLCREIPNNFITRWLVGQANKKMKTSDSRWKLVRRYRGPKQGTYSMWGDVTMSNSKYFSLYLRVR